MILKSDVRVRGIRPEIVVAMMVANSIFYVHGVAMVVTSGTEGTHSRTSLHYTGCAFDARIRDIPDETLRAIVKELKGGLGPDFDVVVENTHIHIEYQPKGE